MSTECTEEAFKLTPLAGLGTIGSREYYTAPTGSNTACSKHASCVSLLLFFSVFLFSQDSQLVEIETNDGNIFLGTVIEESDIGYRLKTQDGIVISVPLASIKRVSKIETAEVDGQVWRADPNKSMYLFAPSAFPIEKQKAYCRDFCLVFPSYNRGFGNNFSLQAFLNLFLLAPCRYSS